MNIQMFYQYFHLNYQPNSSCDHKEYWRIFMISQAKLRITYALRIVINQVRGRLIKLHLQICSFYPLQCDIVILTSVKITQAIYYICKNKKHFQPWDFDISYFYLFMNEFGIESESEYSVYSYFSSTINMLELQ